MAARMQRLNVRLSYLLEDTVAAYSDDGQDYFSYDRDFLLNTSSRILYDAFISTYDSLLSRVKSRSRGEVDPAADILKDFIVVKLMNLVGRPTSRGFTDYANGDTDCAGIWLDDYPSGAVYRVKRPLRLSLTVSGGNTEKKNYKLIPEYDIPLVFSDLPKFSPTKDGPLAFVTFNAAKTAKYLRVLPVHTSGTAVVFSWLQYPNTDLTSAGTEDIQWSSTFDTALLQIAYACSLIDDGKLGESEALLMSVFKRFNIPADPNVENAKQIMRNKP